MESTSCPVCGQPNRSEARFCWACGAALVRICPGCNAPNRPLARFCIRCGAHLGATPAAPDVLAATATASEPVIPAVVPSASLRVLEASTYPGFGRSQGKGVDEPAARFRVTETAFHIRLRLVNLDPARSHSHRLFVQFFRPNGRLHLSRERAELVIAPSGRAEVTTSIFGLRISGTEVVNYPGTWRAVVYLDEEKLTELPFDIATAGGIAAR